MSRQRWAVMLACGLLTACASLPPPGSKGFDFGAWGLNGRLAIRYGGEAATAAFRWRQAGESSVLELSGPFGTGGLRATLDGQGLVLEDARGGRLEGEAARNWLEQSVGGPLPLGHLRWWLLGRPDPALESVVDPAPDGAVFRQAGWGVTAERFESWAGESLPTRLKLVGPGGELRLAVTRWESGP